MLYPVDHHGMEVVGDRKPLAPDGKSHCQRQRVLASGDPDEDVLLVPDHVEIVDALADILYEPHDPGLHPAFDDVGVREL